MFTFRGKTIEEFRNEVIGFLGKEITLVNGQKRILDDVTENGEHSISTMTGNFGFMPHNGEFDWNKGVKGVKMFGFMVTVSITDSKGRKCSNTEKVLVPFDDRNNKTFIANYNEESIFK